MKRFLLISLTWLTCLTGPTSTSASGGSQPTIVLKAMIVNPSDKETQKVPVEIPLPREATKKDVLEAGGLDVRFDSEQGVYKVMGEVTLQPNEQKTIEVKIADIWLVPEKDIQFQKGYTEELVKVLSEKGPYVDTAKKLGESIRSRLEKIVADQNESVAPSKHIQIHRDHLTLFDETKKDIRFLEKIASDRMPLPDGGIDVDRSVGKGSPADELKTITLKILVKNPSETEKALLAVDYYLPREVKEKDVLNAGDLEARYDLTRGAVYLHKDEVPLGAAEHKVFEVVLRDLWRVDPETVKELEVKAVGMSQGFDGTKFEPAAEKMKIEVVKRAGDIEKSQANAVGRPIDEHIAAFVENLTLLEEMKKKIEQMAQVQAVASANPQATPESMGLESPKEEIKDEAKVKVARVQFKDMTPDKKTLWKVIFGIVGFLGLISLLSYLLWWIQAKTEKGLLTEGAE